MTVLTLLLGSSAAIGADGTIYVGFTGMTAISAEGTLKWSFDPEINGDGLSPALGPDGTLYFFSKAGLVALGP